MVRTDLTFASITVVLWASAFAGIRAGLASYSPESVALLRYLVASMVFALIALAMRFPLPEKRDIPGIALSGFLGFTVYNVALNAGEVRVAAGIASFIVASGPIFTAIFATLLFHERLKWAGWLGIAISFSGVGVISLSDGLSLNADALLILLAAVVQALYFVIQKPYLKKYGAFRFITYAVWFGTLFLAIFLPTLLREARHAHAEATLAIVYMGIFPGALGFVCWTLVLARLPAAFASSFLYLIPALAVLIAWVWLGEVPTVTSLLGGGVIMTGVIITTRWGK